MPALNLKQVNTVAMKNAFPYLLNAEVNDD
jgi:hypothetical protein